MPATFFLIVLLDEDSVNHSNIECQPLYMKNANPNNAKIFNIKAIKTSISGLPFDAFLTSIKIKIKTLMIKHNKPAITNDIRPLYHPTPDRQSNFLRMTKYKYG